MHAVLAARAYDSHRGSSAARGYGYRWSTYTRPRILRRDPLCRDPFGTGCQAPSEHVDHAIPKPLGTDDDRNLQGLCKADHARKTLVEQGVVFKRICECEVMTRCCLETARSNVIALACDDHAPTISFAINKWPQIVCFQSRG